MNRNIGRAVLAYLLSLISPAIAQPEHRDTPESERDWVIREERPRDVAEAGDRESRSQRVGKARSGTEAEPGTGAATVWGRRPEGNDGRRSDGAPGGLGRLSKSEPIAASGAASSDSGTGGSKSGGGSSGDKDAGDRDAGDGGTSGGRTGGGTGERDAGEPSADNSDSGSRSTGDRDQGSSGGGNSGNSGRDR